MKYFITVCMFFLFVNSTVFSQEKNTTHRVEKGETINQIAQKYKVTPFDIYQLNPDAQSGLKLNSVLLIPKSSGKQVVNVPIKASVITKSNSPAKTHLVTAKETLYGIEKKYGVSDEVLKKANPSLEKEGLQIGQTLVIPNNSNVKNTAVIQDKLVYHEVLPKETKYSIAKKYGITID